MNIRLIKRVLQVTGVLMSLAGTFVDARIQQEDTEKAVNKYMNKYVNDAVQLALADKNNETTTQV